MPSEYIPKKLLVKKLYTLNEIAGVLHIAPGTAQYWYEKQLIPEPFAVYGNQNNRLWTSEQLIKIRSDYAEATKDKGVNRGGKARNTPKEEVDFEAPIPEEVDDFPRCPTCGEIAFNQNIHDKFAHYGINRKLEAVGAK